MLAQKCASSIDLFFKSALFYSAIMFAKVSNTWEQPNSIGGVFQGEGQFYLITCAAIQVKLLRLMELPVSHCKLIHRRHQSADPNSWCTLLIIQQLADGENATAAGSPHLLPTATQHCFPTKHRGTQGIWLSCGSGCGASAL